MSHAARIEWPVAKADGQLSLPRIVVEFHRQGPLVQHQIAVVTPEETTPCLTAWQAESVDDWPASPPLQSCQSMEDRQGRPVVLATGLAGRSHWSLSVSISESDGLLFDVACRTGAEASFLGSTYQLTRAGWAEREGAAELSWGGQRAILRPALAAAGRLQFHEPGQLVVVPDSPSTAAGATVRWATNSSCSRLDLPRTLLDNPGSTTFARRRSWRMEPQLHGRRASTNGQLRLESDAWSSSTLKN